MPLLHNIEIYTPLVLKVENIFLTIIRCTDLLALHHPQNKYCQFVPILIFPQIKMQLCNRELKNIKNPLQRVLKEF